MELVIGATVEITGQVVKGKTYGSRQTTLIPIAYPTPVRALVLGKSQRHTGTLTGGYTSLSEYEPAYLTGIVTHSVYMVMPLDKHNRYRKPIAVLPEQIAVTRSMAGQERWLPIDFVQLEDGFALHCDNIAFTIGKGNMARDTIAWPEDSYEYAICRRVPAGEASGEADGA